MTIVVAVVRVVMVVVVVNGRGTVRTIRTVRARIVRIPNVVGVGSVPTPSVVETAVVPEGIVVVGTIVVIRPPPVVTQVDAYAKAGWAVVIPVHVGEEGVVVTKTHIDIGVKSAESGTVAIIVVIVRIIRATSSRTYRCRCR